jgi:hypothetical protein
MATLRDINTTLRDQLAVQERIDANIDSYITERRQSRLAELEALREAGRGSRGSRGSGGGGLGASIGGALVGGALGRGAIGLAAMGAAIPAFFGGLVAGDAAFTWLKSMGASFDFAGLKAAAIGFSDIITEMRPESFIALAGIMGVSAVGGRRGAVGLGFMGLAISGFLGGLLAGDLLFKGVSWIGYNLDFNGLKQAAVGFSDVIMSMDKKTWIVLGGIMTASAVAGRRGAIGLGFMGLAISGFLGGLLAGDLLFEGVSALGGSLDFNNLKTMLTGFSASISALTPEAVAALGAILAGGAIVGYSPLRARSLAKGLGAIGAGMIALFGGLLVGETLSEGAAVLGANLDFANITTMFAGFSQAIGSLDENAITKLGILLGAGGVFGAVTSNRTKARVVAGVGAIGASIAAFFTAFALGGVAVDKMATDGSAISTIVKNFGDAISSLDGQAITVLGSLIGAGGVLGALTVATGGAGVVLLQISLDWMVPILKRYCLILLQQLMN